jgi:hypothetical protein
VRSLHNPDAQARERPTSREFPLSRALKLRGSRPHGDFPVEIVRIHSSQVRASRFRAPPLALEFTENVARVAPATEFKKGPAPILDRNARAPDGGRHASQGSTARATSCRNSHGIHAVTVYRRKVIPKHPREKPHDANLVRPSGSPSQRKTVVARMPRSARQDVASGELSSARCSGFRRVRAIPHFPREMAVA